MKFRFIVILSAFPLLLLGPAKPLLAEQVKFINVLTTRNYAGDEALYKHFTSQTGIAVRLMEGEEDLILGELKENQKSFPADVFISVDVGVLARADTLELLEPLRSEVIEARVPATLRQDNWFAFASRARVITHNADAFEDKRFKNYEDVADPALKGLLCGPNNMPSNDRSLVASMLANADADTARGWLKNLVSNRGGAPIIDEITQLRWLAEGDCDLTLTNTTSLANYLRSTEEADVKGRNKIVVVWPNQESTGTHVMYSGGALVKTSKRKEAGRRLLEFLVSDLAQQHLADHNTEWPAVPGIPVNNPLLKEFSTHRLDALPMVRLAAFQEASVGLSSEVGGAQRVISPKK